VASFIEVRPLSRDIALREIGVNGRTGGQPENITIVGGGIKKRENKIKKNERKKSKNMRKTKKKKIQKRLHLLQCLDFRQQKMDDISSHPTRCLGSEYIKNVCGGASAANTFFGVFRAQPTCPVAADVFLFRLELKALPKF